ncbi:MAG TPA: DNA-binding response regulator [Clostridiales bacterium UBA8153]|nr:DNA-binding response regulator [Clostridiales bacterium UBA8153]
MAAKILVVEDEGKIRELLKAYLEGHGYQVHTAGSGAEALSRIAGDRPDLVLLDVMLPGMDGLDVCRRLRQTSRVPVIFLSARTEEIDRLLGLELGADDYITKPFSPREVVARVRAVLRRLEPAGAQGEVLRVGAVEINLPCHEVWAHGQPVALTPTEFSLLVTLLRHPGRTYTRLQLLDVAMGNSYEGYERSVDTHISNLRKKIELDPARPQYVLTVYGVGYKGGNLPVAQPAR